MELIAITQEGCCPWESRAIEYMIDCGFSRIHIRKPMADADSVAALIGSIDRRCYPYLSLHDHHALAVRYGLGGVHLNSRWPEVPSGFGGLVSRSCHSVGEAAMADCDYCFLSPIFDSISKSGYRAAFDRPTLAAALATTLAARKVIALGGVTAGHLPELAGLGFNGAAFLGAIWRGTDFKTIGKNIDEIVRACVG